MQERAGAITFQGNPLTLVGQPIQTGTPAPDATLLDPSLTPVTISSFRGRTVVVSVVPSLDTGVCDRQTRRFNQEATSLGDRVVVLTISMDLPFAQARWCGSAGVERVLTLSDHREASFGNAWGLLIKELRLLARAVYVLDAEGVVRHAELVPEMTHEPDYDAALTCVRSLVG